MKILISGFNPFASQTINPAWEAVQRVEIPNHELIKVQLPTEFDASASQLSALVAQYSPDILIGVGQAGGRAKISLERVAINLIDAPIADNAGSQPIDEQVIDQAPAAYFSNLPLKAILKTLLENKIPAEISNTAGTYVCNHLMFNALHLASQNPRMRAGFIHVPFLKSQVETSAKPLPFLELEQMVKALKIAIEVTASTSVDLKIQAGNTH